MTHNNNDDEAVTQLYLVAYQHCIVPNIRRFLDEKALDDEIKKQLTEKDVEMPLQLNVEHELEAFDEIVRRIHEAWVQDFGITFMSPEAPEAMLAGDAGDSTNNNTNNRADKKHGSRKPNNAKTRAARSWRERKLLPPPPGARDSQRAGIASLFEQHYGKIEIINLTTIEEEEGKERGGNIMDLTMDDDEDIPGPEGCTVERVGK